MARKAVIVAAGLSSRLYPLTIDTPKALLDVGKETLLARSLRLVKKEFIAGIAVVVGYHADSMGLAMGTAAQSIDNPFFRHCNNMGSLWMAKSFIGDDPFVYLHGDLIYSERTLHDFLEAAAQPGESCIDLLTDFGEVDDEAMKVRVDENRRLVESNKSIPLNEAAGEWTGIAVIHQPDIVFAAIENHLMNVSLTDYDTAAFSTLARAGHEIRCIAASGDPWKEIDTLEDLESARALFGEDD